MPEPGEYLTVRLHNALGGETGLQPAFLGRLPGELQSPDAKGTGPCFRATVSRQDASSRRKMDQSPDFAVLLGLRGIVALVLRMLCYAEA